MTAHCPALLIAAPASGQGKTTATAALARRARNQGRRVRVFKSGPDFLDPTILERASGAPVHNLDLWMVGEARCRRLLFDAAREADLILIEGVMGLFDGEPSSADIAERFGIPVLAVIDAGAMAQSFGAVAFGLANYRPGLPFAGVLANHVASAGHGRLLAASLPEGVRWYGGLPKRGVGGGDFSLPSRHLGLIHGAELDDLDERLDRAAAALPPLEFEPEAVAFEAGEEPAPPRLLEGVTVAVARDRAFCFLYPDNPTLLAAMGATVVEFSPLADDKLPDCDALYLPGGYPELYLESLERNEGMKGAIRAHHAAGLPIVAECGGMLYLLERLADGAGGEAAMVGLLPGRGELTSRVTGLGTQQAELPEGTLRGHTGSSA